MAKNNKKNIEKLCQGGKRGSANVKRAGSANSQKDKIVKYVNKPKNNQIK